MKVERKIHLAWVEWQQVKATLPDDQTLAGRGPVIGKYQYIYSSPKGKISLVELPDYFRDAKTLWEIYCQEGDLFDDVQRFDSKEEAVEQITVYLE